VSDESEGDESQGEASDVSAYEEVSRGGAASVGGGDFLRQRPVSMRTMPTTTATRVRGRKEGEGMV
jgi:hypothetical protein